MTDSPTLRALIARRELRLALVSAAASVVGALDAPVRWVHSSDLADPTPFLADDIVLLTTGGQFRGDDPTDATTYVARLVARGVRGLGYGTRVHSPEVPPALIAACADAGMPLFEVPYATPFIAIAQAHAEAIAAQASARREWALRSQRALTTAALRPHGWESTLSEAARILDAWTGMFDASGALVHAHAASALPHRETDAIAAHARTLIARGTPAAEPVEAGGRTVTLFTVGQGGALRGAVAIARESWDAEARAVATTAVAMAEVALEQRSRLDADRARLAAQVMASLRRDDPTLAQAVLGADALPDAPIVVAVAESAGGVAEVERWFERRGVRAFVAADAADAPVGTDARAATTTTTVVSAADAAVLDDLAAELGIRVGVSSAAGYDAFGDVDGQARLALRRGPQQPGATRFDDAVSDSILSAADDDARLAARARLAPLDAHPGLADALRVWLAHDAHIERAAVALGIHRHTLRTRIADASRLLGLDLATFPARAELWAALRWATPVP